MSKKEKFIEEISKLLQDAPENFLSSDALEYWNGLQITDDKGKGKFTENGKLILHYMKEHKEEYNNLFKAKDIGEGIGISSRSVSGTMRKLVSDSFVEKMGDSPIVYSLTAEGAEVNIDN